MRLLTEAENKQIELDILLRLVEFCNAHKLTYFLAYGTLIGAVRHGGFIPWDDDIDVNMPREDYEYLISHADEFDVSGRYRIISPFNKESHHSFVKVIDTHTVKIEAGLCYHDDCLGVDVDIFPLDGEPDDDEAFDRFYEKLMKTYRMYVFCVSDAKLSLKRRIAIPLIRIVYGKKRMLKKARKIHAKYPYKTARFVGAIESAYNSKGNRFEKEWFSSTTLVDFEGHKLFAPVGYDKILTRVYGDYMQLPPAEKQVTHHRSRAYIKE